LTSTCPYEPLHWLPRFLDPNCALEIARSNRNKSDSRIPNELRACINSGVNLIYEAPGGVIEHFNEPVESFDFNIKGSQRSSSPSRSLQGDRNVELSL